MACFAGIKEGEVYSNDHSTSAHYRYDPEVGAENQEVLRQILDLAFEDPMAFSNLPAGGFRKSMKKDLDIDYKDDKFWTPTPEMFHLGNMSMLFAYCRESEQACVYFRRYNAGAPESKKYTRMQLTIEDAEKHCEYAEMITKEIDACGHGKRIPTLEPLGDKACMNYRDKDFWDYGVCRGTGDMRCRAVEDATRAVLLLVNTERTSTQYGDDYIGPVLVFSLMMMRTVFAKMRANIKRYYEDSDYNNLMIC